MRRTNKPPSSASPPLTVTWDGVDVKAAGSAKIFSFDAQNVTSLDLKAVEHDGCDLVLGRVMELLLLASTKDGDAMSTRSAVYLSLEVNIVDLSDSI